MEVVVLSSTRPSEISMRLRTCTEVEDAESSCEDLILASMRVNTCTGHDRWWKYMSRHAGSQGKA